MTNRDGSFRQAASGRYFMDFKQKIMTKTEQNAFIESMNLGKQQNLFFMEDLGASVQILAGLIGLIAVTCLCAYLLIYNIMYLSVAGKVRYYGLLQTVGMTEKQIKRMMKEQMLLIGSAGTVLGCLSGGLVSFFLIPVVVKSLGIKSGYVGADMVRFHPAVLLGNHLTGWDYHLSGQPKTDKNGSRYLSNRSAWLSSDPQNRKRKKNGKGESNSKTFPRAVYKG